MQLYLYNTLTRSKEIFRPIDLNLVKIYSCGPTVYGDPHVGNLRAYTFADILKRTIKHIAGYKVKHVVNITDVGELTDDGDQAEDKIEKGSKREGLSARDIARKYETNFKKYVNQLHIDPYDQMPRATEYIQDQIDIVQQLESKGYTYIISNDGVYMDTSKVADYGKLLGPSYKVHLHGLQAGARVEDSGKKNPTDFALRKFSPSNMQRQMERESPRGKGFPGRHIECSAMSRATLGDHFDIHTGGMDHIPIHHTNEIAQSECTFTHGKQRVNYWMHCQFLNIAGKKVSKSAGDDLSLPGIEAKGFSALDLRYFYFQAHYRSFQDFTRESLDAAHAARNKLLSGIFTYLGLHEEQQQKYFLKQYNSMTSTVQEFQETLTPQSREMLTKLISPLLDDIDTPKFLANFHQTIKILQKNDFVGEQERDLRKAIFFIEKYILQLGLKEYIESMIHHMHDRVPTHIQALAEQRRQAKLAKDYTTADALRSQLHTAGREMLDTTDGYNLQVYKAK